MERYRQLDALRGIAALSVVLLHYVSINPFYLEQCNLTLASCGWVYALKYSPLHLLVNGNEAVVLFFILSGFVLYLSFDVVDRSTYERFLVRRFFRINIPFYVACAMAFALIFAISPKPVPGLDSYFNDQWTRLPTWHDALMSLLFVFGFDHMMSVSPSWSLVFEIHYSIAFPLIVWLVNRYRAGRLIVASFVVAFLASVAIKVVGDHVFIKTFTFAPDFIVGACLARHRLKVVEAVKRLSRLQLILLFVVAILGYTYNAWFFPAVKNLHWLYVTKLFVIPACTVLLAICIAVPVMGGVLLSAPAQWVGKLSYGIYLYHVIPVLVLGHLFFDSWGYFPVVAVSLLATFALAAASWRFIEAPAIRAGHRLNARSTERRLSKASQ